MAGDEDGLVKSGAGAVRCKVGGARRGLVAKKLGGKPPVKLGSKAKDRKLPSPAIRRACFLEVLRRTANVSRAAREAGLASSTVYAQRGRSAGFAAEWDAAVEAADDDALLAGRNLALIGDELIQFGAVQPLGNGRFRLSRLWRGRLGTEWAMAAHEAGERFVLIERESLLAVEPGRAALNTPVALLASGIGDVAGPARADMLFRGRNVLPYAPVRLEAEEWPGGDLAVQWIRRDRAGFVWTDGVDVPMSEAVEAWQIQVMRGDLVLRTVTRDGQGWIYEAALRQADGTMPGARFDIMVRQLGVFGPGQPGRVAIAA